MRGARLSRARAAGRLGGSALRPEAAEAFLTQPSTRAAGQRTVKTVQSGVKEPVDQCRPHKFEI